MCFDILDKLYDYIPYIDIHLFVCSFSLPTIMRRFLSFRMYHTAIYVSPPLCMFTFWGPFKPYMIGWTSNFKHCNLISSSTRAILCLSRLTKYMIKPELLHILLNFIELFNMHKKCLLYGWRLINNTKTTFGPPSKLELLNDREMNVGHWLFAKSRCAIPCNPHQNVHEHYLRLIRGHGISISWPQNKYFRGHKLVFCGHKNKNPPPPGLRRIILQYLLIMWRKNLF